jgi:hypothetical protein
MRRRPFTFATAALIVLCQATATRGGQAHFLACSGPNAWKVMLDADLYGASCAVWVTLLLVPTVYIIARSGHPALALTHLLLLLLHPAWTVSAYSGDCGRSKEFFSTVFVVLAAASVLESIYIAVYFRRPWPWRWRRQHPRIGFCPNCDYNLTGNVSGVCPECGTTMDRRAPA